MSLDGSRPTVTGVYALAQSNRESIKQMERRFDRFEKDNRYLWHEVSSKIDTKIDVLTDKLVTHQIASLEKNGSAKAKAARDSMKVTVLWIVVGGAIMTALQLATSFISKLF